MIGSYGPSAESYEKKFQSEEAPSGMFAKGHYEAKVIRHLSRFLFFFFFLLILLIQSKFVDDDGVSHMEWNWSLDIKKDW